MACASRKTDTNRTDRINKSLCKASSVGWTLSTRPGHSSSVTDTFTPYIHIWLSYTGSLYTVIIPWTKREQQSRGVAVSRIQLIHTGNIQMHYYSHWLKYRIQPVDSGPNDCRFFFLADTSSAPIGSVWNSFASSGFIIHMFGHSEWWHCPRLHGRDA